MKRLRNSSVPAAVTLVLLALLDLAGCGARRAILNVDLLSFTPALQSAFNVPTVPANNPPFTSNGQQTIVADQNVNLLSGFSNAATVQDVSLRLRTITNATTGSGVDTLRIFLSDANTVPTTTVPILTQLLTFTGGVADTVTSTVDGNAQLNALFAQKQLRIAVTTSFRGPSSGADLTGASLKVNALDAVIIAGRKL